MLAKTWRRCILDVMKGFEIDNAVGERRLRITAIGLSTYTFSLLLKSLPMLLTLRFLLSPSTLHRRSDLFFFTLSQTLGFLLLPFQIR